MAFQTLNFSNKMSSRISLEIKFWITFNTGPETRNFQGASAQIQLAQKGSIFQKKEPHFHKQNGHFGKLPRRFRSGICFISLFRSQFWELMVRRLDDEPSCQQRKPPDQVSSIRHTSHELVEKARSSTWSKRFILKRFTMISRQLRLSRVQIWEASRPAADEVILAPKTACQVHMWPGKN